MKEITFLQMIHESYGIFTQYDVQVFYFIIIIIFIFFYQHMLIYCFTCLPVCERFGGK